MILLISIVSIGLLVLSLSGILVFFLRDRNMDGSSNDDSSSIVTFVPVWIGVWILLWGATRRKRQELDRNSQMIIVGIGILVALIAVAGLVIFLAVK